MQAEEIVLMITRSQLEVLDMLFSEGESSIGFYDKDCAYCGKIKSFNALQKKVQRLKRRKINKSERKVV